MVFKSLKASWKSWLGFKPDGKGRDGGTGIKAAHSARPPPPRTPDSHPAFHMAWVAGLILRALNGSVLCTGRVWLGCY